MSDPITRQDLQEAIGPIHSRLDRLESGQAELNGKVDHLNGKVDRVITLILKQQTGSPDPPQSDPRATARLDDMAARVETVQQEYTLGHARLRRRVRRLERHQGLRKKLEGGAGETTPA